MFYLDVLKFMAGSASICLCSPPPILLASLCVSGLTKPDKNDTSSDWYTKRAEIVLCDIQSKDSVYEREKDRIGARMSGVIFAVKQWARKFCRPRGRRIQYLDNVEADSACLGTVRSLMSKNTRKQFVESGILQLLILLAIC